MALYNSPKLKLGGLNTIFNPDDFNENDEPVTIGIGDARYLKLTGGTETGSVIFNQSITVPSITLSSNSISQTSSQVGYLKSFSSAITGGSVQNGSVITPSFNTISLTAGVWIINYYHSISCTASITYSLIQHGITTSSTGTFLQSSSTNSYSSETVASGNRYCSGSYFVRPSSTTSYYAPILISCTTAGTITINLGISGIRIA